MLRIKMLNVKFNANAGTSWINTIRSGIATSRPEILDQVGNRLVGLARIYFDNLSRGGCGFSGRSWRPPQPSTIRRRAALARQGRLVASPQVQGIVTGEMRQSLGFETSDRGVKLLYADQKAAYFNVWRRLIPTVLPKPWRAACEQIVQSKVNSISRSS